MRDKEKQFSSFVKEKVTQRKGLSIRVIRVFFEGCSKNADLFVLDVAFKSFQYPLNFLFSIIVIREDSIPVFQ